MRIYIYIYIYMYIYSVYNCVLYTLTHASRIIWYLNSTTCLSLLIFAFFFLPCFIKVLFYCYVRGWLRTIRSIDPLAQCRSFLIIIFYFLLRILHSRLRFLLPLLLLFPPRTSALNILSSFPFTHNKVQLNWYFVYVYTYRNRPRKNYNAPLCL